MQKAKSPGRKVSLLPRNSSMYLRKIEKTSVDLKHDHAEIFCKRLVRNVRRRKVGTTAAKLWGAAYKAAMDPLKSLFEEVEKDYPSKVRSEEHWSVFVDRLENTTDLFARLFISGGRKARNRGWRRIEKFSERNDYTTYAGFDIWAIQGRAIRDAIEHLGIRLPQVIPKQKTPPKPRIIGVCFVCWRTGLPMQRSTQFLCSEHRSLGSKYKRALERRLWRAPDQPEERRDSFVWYWARGIKEALPYAIRAELSDLSPLRMICFGADDALEHTQDWSVRLKLYWKHFPRVRRFVQRASASKRINLNDAASVLRALDPIGRRERALHLAMHECMSKDHRLFYDRLMYAEGCLEADARRRRNRGPKARRQDVDELVVPYHFGY